MKISTLRINMGVFLFVLYLLTCVDAYCQTTTIGGVETATQDRLEDPGWWPTKGSYPRNSFVGSATCQQCHADLSRPQRTTPMAHAAQLAGSPSPREKTPLTLENGPYSYLLQSSESGPLLSVMVGAERDTIPLTWTFGSGQIGRTYVYQKEGVWFESRVSLYTNSGQLDITAGHNHFPPESLEQAAGREMKDQAARRCFSCHTSLSTVAGNFEAQKAIPGITCEACHGPGADHVKSVTSARGALTSTNIVNPAKMSPVDSVDFCGACHRTWADIAFSGVAKRGAEVVRFQPYRLEKSRCWGEAGDARVTCVACHDPHLPLRREAASYDTECLSCHLRQGEIANSVKPEAACPRATDHCTTCHMPKVKVPDMHGEFTDHFIRVVDPRGVLPE